MPRRRVLIIDDEPRIQALLERTIAQWGHDVDLAGSAEAAANQLRQQPADVIFLDLNLPGKSGDDFLDELKQRWPEARIIILTGFGDLDAAQKAIRHQVVDFITKPFDLGDIERALDLALRGPQSAGASLGARPPAESLATPQSLEEMEREMIQRAMQRHAGNQTAAAKELGITRRTLYNKLQRYQIDT